MIKMTMELDHEDCFSVIVRSVGHPSHVVCVMHTDSVADDDQLRERLRAGEQVTVTMEVEP